MLFSAKNEGGIPTWVLVAEGTKTVTRRLKPQPVGKIRAVQPGRGKKAVCYVRIPSCLGPWNPLNAPIPYTLDYVRFPAYACAEARLEGYKTPQGLLGALKEHHGDPLPPLYRIGLEQAMVENKLVGHINGGDSELGKIVGEVVG